MECSHRHGFSLPISSLGSNDDELTTMTPTRALVQLGLGIKLVRCCRLPLHRRLPPKQCVRV